MQQNHRVIVVAALSSNNNKIKRWKWQFIGSKLNLYVVVYESVWNKGPSGDLTTKVLRKTGSVGTKVVLIFRLIFVRSDDFLVLD